MPRPINETHDPALTSWVESANDPANDFPIQNLPFVAWGEADDDHEHCYRGGVRIGDFVFDLGAGADTGLFDGITDDDGSEPAFGLLFSVLELPPAALTEIRSRISGVLRADNPALRGFPSARARVMRPIGEVRLGRPVVPLDYTDFYASIHHATNVGSMFRPDNPLLPNYKWVPIGYHGRASSIVADGSPVRRPSGQLKADDAPAPVFAPCRMLDYELEVGFIVGRGNELGSPVPIGQAEEHIAGLCLVNDWSARDIQKWEYQPLGPFLAKNFATTISPYVVTLDALAPFRCPAYRRPEGDPAPLPHLFDEGDRAHGGFDLTLEVRLASRAMRERAMPPVRLSRTGFRDMYWTMAQLLAHHTSGGCNMQPGDLLGSGTVSGPEPGSRGCLLELTWGGPGKPRVPIELPTGEKRIFLEDGDEVTLTGWCEREGRRRIGLGQCRGTVIG